MKTTLKALAIVAALAPVPAMADEIALASPLAGATLHEGAVDMSVFFTEGEAGAYDVVATYAPASDAADAARLRMQLADGDRVSFSLPEHRDTVWGFERDGNVLRAVAEPLARTFAALD